MCQEGGKKKRKRRTTTGLNSEWKTGIEREKSVEETQKDRRNPKIRTPPTNV